MTRWTEADGPVLRAIAAHEDGCASDGACGYSRSQIVAETELPEPTVTGALRRLHGEGLIVPDIDRSRGRGVDWHHAAGLRTTGRGLQRLGEWPPDLMAVHEVADLAAYFDRLADETDDLDQADRLRTLGTAVAGMTRDVATAVLSALAVRGLAGM